jgi:hypothetical protein
MAVKPCTACNEKYPGKPSSIYSAWMGGQGREAYRASLCMECVHRHIAPYVKRSLTRGLEDGCDECGGVLKGEFNPVWLNIYLPKREQEAFELNFCDADVQLARSRLAHMSRQLPDRQLVSSQGPVNGQTDDTSVPW